MAIVIDSHHHLWQLGQFNYRWLDAPALAPIKRNFLPTDLKPLLDRAGVHKTIVVQTQHCLEENRWALELARQYDFIAGVVGWVDLRSPECEQHLQEWIANPKFVGIRHVVQDEPDEDFVIRPEFLRGLAVLEKLRIPFDMLFYVQHLKHAVTLARQFPQLTLILDHLSKPKIKDHQLSGWQKDLRAAAKFPNVVCKLSGMVTEADWQHWTADDLKPYVQEALQAFGPERLMFGSDWPVCELAGSYESVYEGTRTALGNLPTAATAAIFGGTAERVYLQAARERAQKASN